MLKCSDDWGGSQGKVEAATHHADHQDHKPTWTAHTASRVGLHPDAMWVPDHAAAASTGIPRHTTSSQSLQAVGRLIGRQEYWSAPGSDLPPGWLWGAAFILPGHRGGAGKSHLEARPCEAM